MEKDVVARIHDYSQQEILCIHQKDPELGFAFYEAGYEYLLDNDKLVRDGKSEGMIAGMILAKSLGKDFIGFTETLSDLQMPTTISLVLRVNT
jgi:mannosyl-3-phosphoglycerate synthase